MRKIIFLNEDAASRQLENIDKQISRLNPQDPQYEKKKADLQARKARIDPDGSAQLRMQTGKAVGQTVQQTGGHTQGTVSAIDAARDARSQNIQTTRAISKEQKLHNTAIQNGQDRSAAVTGQKISNLKNAQANRREQNLNTAAQTPQTIQNKNTPAQAPVHKTGTAHLADTANAQSLQAHRQKLDRHLVQNGPNNGNVRYDPETNSLKPRDNWVK